MRTVACWLIVLGLVGLGAPAAADANTHVCTILVGTELPSPTGGSLGASTTGPGGGVGECELHTLDERSKTLELDPDEGCQIYADTNGDLFVEEKVGEERVYYPGTSFIAFCEAGVVMADNAISLTSI